jgi:hypothetical protein
MRTLKRKKIDRTSVTRGLLVSARQRGDLRREKAVVPVSGAVVLELGQ